MSAARLAQRLVVALTLVAAWSMTAWAQPIPSAAAGSTVGGRITVVETGMGVLGATVELCATGSDGCSPIATATSGSDGSFAIASVTDGTYRILIRPPAPDPLGLLYGWYSSVEPHHLAFRQRDATTVAIPGADLSDLSIGLPVGHRLGGRVTLFGTGVPATDVQVKADVCPTGEANAFLPWPSCENRWVQAPTWSVVRTASDGTFTTDLLADGSYQLTLSEGGILAGWYAEFSMRHYTTDPSEAERVSLAGGDLTGLEIVATGAAQHTISGRVTVLGTDTAVSGARISLGDTQDGCRIEDLGCLPLVVTTTGPDGRYTTPPLTDGTYPVRVDPPLDDPNDLVWNWYPGPAVTVGGSDVTGIDMGLPVGHRISGRLSVEGTNAPVVGAAVGVLPCTDLKCVVLASAVSSSTGTFSTGLLRDGSYFLDAQGVGWYTDSIATHAASLPWDASPIVVAGADVTGIDMVASGVHSISGRILAAGTLATVAGATVISCVASEPGLCSTFPSTTSSTGDFTLHEVNGRYLLQVLAPDPNPLGVVGGWYASTSWTGYASSSGDATPVVVEGTDVTGLTVYLPGSHRVTGRITAAGTDAGVVSARVRLCRTDEWRFCDEIAATSTTSSGDFAISGVPTGSFDLLVDGVGGNPLDVLPGWYSATTDGHYVSGHSTATSIVVDRDVSGLTLALPVGHRISGRITELTTGSGIVASVHIDDCWPGAEFCANPKATVQRDFTITTDANGYYRSEVLPDGSYRWSVMAVGRPDLMWGWYSAIGPSHVTPDESTSTRIVIAGSDATGIDAALGPRPCDGCQGGGGTGGDQSGGTTGDTTAWTTGAANGGGWQWTAGGRATFAFSVESSVPPSGGPAVVVGHLTWLRPGVWRFDGTLRTYVTNGGVTTASGTGVLEYRRAGHRGPAWVRATSGPTTVTIRIVAGGGRNAPDRGSFGIEFSGTRAAGIPSLPFVPRSPIGGGTVRIR